MFNAVMRGYEILKLIAVFAALGTALTGRLIYVAVYAAGYDIDQLKNEQWLTSHHYTAVGRTRVYYNQSCCA